MKKYLLFIVIILATIISCSKSDPENQTQTPGTPDTPKQESITLDNGTNSNPTVSSSGSTTKISFNSSTAWTASIINANADSWCSISPASGGAGSAVITITVKENTSPDNRSASIIIKAGNATKTIKIEQKQKDALTTTTSSFEVGVEGGEIKVIAKSNVPFAHTISKDAQNWIKAVSTKALKDSVLTFEISANNNVSRRSGMIFLENGTLKDTINVYQKGEMPTIVVSKNEYTLGSEGGNIEVEVTSNVNATANIIHPQGADTWLTANVTRSVSTNKFYFSAKKNETYDSRTALIIFRNVENNVADTVSVSQMQHGIINVNKEEFSLDANGGEITIEIEHSIGYEYKISEEWIKKVETRALEKSNLTFSIDPNKSKNKRECTINIFSTEKGISRIIKVIQAGGNTLSGVKCAPNEILYTTKYGLVIELGNTLGFGGNLVYNTYENGIGKLVFGNDITAIPDNAFKNCNSIENILLPDGIRSIGKSAFVGCTSIKKIEVPKGVISIGENAFYELRNLTEINIPNGVISIGNHAFSSCLGLKKIQIPESVTIIGEGAFNGMAFLTEINIPEKVTSIQKSTFGNCLSLESITIPKSVSFIGEGAFYQCAKLSSIQIPESVKKIGESAFYCCNSITQISVPNGVTEIGEKTFYYCKNLKNLTIPYSVKTIGEDAFAGCSGEINLNCEIDYQFNKAFYNSEFELVNICEGVTTIEETAFSNCKKIKKFIVPNTITYIGKNAFNGCKGKLIVNCNTNGIQIPTGQPGIVTINGVFENSEFSEIIIGEGVTVIGEKAFYGCNAVNNISIPRSITSIGKNAFYGCTGDITINCNVPDCITNSFGGITQTPFQGAEFKKIIISEGVTRIGDHAFLNLKSITDIIMPNTLITIEDGVFSGCTGLTNITIPKNVTSIGINVFNGITGTLIINCNIPDPDPYWGAFEGYDISEIKIGNNVTKIGEKAFKDCKKLNSITIPNSIQSIGKEAFFGCEGELTIFCDIPDAIIDENSNSFGSFYGSKFTKVAINEGVAKIGSHAFKNCNTITHIDIPNSITTINDHAFENCNALTNITIPNRITNIGKGAFYGCINLTGNIDIPNGITKINAETFYNCKNLNEVKIPDSVNEICDNAFEGCNLLKTVYCESTTPPSLGNNVFDYNYTDRIFYVPIVSVDIYKNAINWTNYKDAIFSKIQGNNEIVYTTEDNSIIELYNADAFSANIISNTYSNGLGIILFDKDISSIGYNAFINCSKITSIYIPNSISSIGDFAFYGCRNLTSIKIPDGVTSVGSRAFSSCSSLKEIEIPDGVTSVGSGAFSSCSSLKEIEIPNSLTSIGSSAFEGCTSLTTINIPNKITTIEEYTFSNCTDLSTVNIPNTVISINRFAFLDCSSLTCIDIPNSVTSIGLAAFYGCSKLSTVILSNNLTKIEQNAFMNCISLTSISIPNLVTSIEAYAFKGCSGLVSINFPSSLTNIKASSFYECSNLSSIIIPNSVKEIGHNAFLGCSKLKDIYLQPITPPSLKGSVVFSDGVADRKMHVLSSSLEAYKTANYWSNYINEFVGDLQNN